MTHSSTYDSANGVNVISIQGTAPIIKLIPFVQKVLTDKDINHSKLILFDIRHFTINNSLVELIQFFEDGQGNKLYFGLSIAFLHNSQDDIFNFIETAGLNRGWSIGSFHNLTKGLDWLKAV